LVQLRPISSFGNKLKYLIRYIRRPVFPLLLLVLVLGFYQIVSITLASRKPEQLIVLAYAGISLPLLLIFTLGNGNYGFFINSEFLAEEIVRTLVGSLGLIAAVPISTLIATTLIIYQERLRQWRAMLGPETSDELEH
jgi:hypothetical protein